MTERDDFDKIVEGLHFDLSFPDEPGDPVPDESVPDESGDVLGSADPGEIDGEEEDTQEPFYRHVDPVPLIPRNRNVVLAWVGVIGAPLSLVLATLAHVFLDRPIVIAAVLIFVASATYLFLQLPEHGPSQSDWPDDGAVL